MGQLKEIEREHVEKAIAECAKLGAEEFVKKLGFGMPTKWWIEQDGKRYPAKAVLGAAYGYAHPEADLLSHKSLGGGPETNGQIAMVTFHQSFAYEDFVEGIRPCLREEDEDLSYELHEGIFKRIARAAAKLESSNKAFVLIIDEINRGNIAKIFGELITLIEDSRRIGKEDETKVTLPYSQKMFGVPGNLYIIGTMNTADRSIQLLDTALRRRFTFFEMMPNHDHELVSDNVDGINCRELMKAMNKGIAELLDREHQIGHTNFFDIDSMQKLADRFQHKIFPLLQEYFFEDWQKIYSVLNKNAFVIKSSRNNDEDTDIYERLPHDDRRWHDPQEYKKIYAGER